ncbi:MAG: 16S rRNA (adenine(1518)-N(6)/adenine(1519)-N(6))-dimethyltransferase RsmA, partial [Candidatus Sungbacteria bacterium]|nr:16S rRNA (adenine(1518)-N(6)/adenine(1519)-N(6))-dimethyltransferase RsmA [Candidatus Sungbacteria bacterium]
AVIEAAELLLSDTIIEIGPGTGVLTKALALRTKQVIAIEKDEALAEELRQNLKKERIDNVIILDGDALKNFPVPDKPYKVVANIPYYLTARLLRMVLEEQKHKPSLIVFTVQKEVAERIIALPPHESILSLSVQAYSTPTIVKNVPASCFSPKPKVDSAIIKIADISDLFFVRNHIDSNNFFRIVRSAFSQKRKVLANTLANVIGDKKSTIAVLNSAGLNPRARPEQLTLQQWAKLVTLITKK